MFNLLEEINYLSCIHCSDGMLEFLNESTIQCNTCGKQYPVKNNIPYFCEVKKDIIPPMENIEYTDYKNWTKWRKLNYHFCEKSLYDIDENNVIIDIGAGRAYFKNLFKKFSKYITLDFYPYENIDIVADFTQKIPLRNDLADIVFVSNVLEHMSEPQFLLEECYRLLKSNGKIIILVPFLIKIHQEPYDFFRYTEYGLDYLLKKAGFKRIELAYLGDIIDLYELFQAAALKTIRKKYNSFIRIKLRIINIINKIIIKNLQKNHKIDCINDIKYVQGYGLIYYK